MVEMKPHAGIDNGYHKNVFSHWRSSPTSHCIAEHEKIAKTVVTAKMAEGVGKSKNLEDGIVAATLPSLPAKMVIPCPKGLGATPTSVDPDEERAAPPEPTLVYFPQNDIQLTGSDEWINRPPNLYKAFSRITKPSDVQLSDLSKLNVTIRNDVELEDFIPVDTDGPAHLPPKSWTQNLDPTSRRPALPEAPGHLKHLILSNGAEAPESETFVKYANELACDTHDGLLAIGHRKPRKGRQAPILNHYREFWSKLEVVSQYWDTELDSYYEVAGSTPPSPTTPKGLRKMSLFMTDKNAPNTKKPDTGNRKYKGFRKSTGSKMPDAHRAELVKFFLRNIIGSFNCVQSVSRKIPQVQIKDLLIPVTLSGVIWRHPEKKELRQGGFQEGPLVGVQCRADTKFSKDTSLATLDAAREIAGCLLLAQERAREGKPKLVPGQGKWYTTRRRWGGGPGGEFGEAEGDKDSHPSAPATRRVSAAPGSWPKKMTEEEIWKQLKPNTGVWEHRTTYIAVGKDRTVDHDAVFMVSSLFHHISILKLEVHPQYIEYMISGQQPPFKNPDSKWYRPIISRTRWFDLLVAQDRLEAYRGVWGVMSYLMRSDHRAPRPQPSRHQSDTLPITNMIASLRRKSHAPTTASSPLHPRANSVS